MSFPNYPAYKDSGVEWIGEIPVGWKIEKFRYIFFESKEKIETEKDISGDMLSVSGYRGVEIKKYDDENKKRLSYELIGYRIVRKRQLVINTMWLNFSGLGVSWLNGNVSPAYRCYSVNENIIDINYTNYLLRSSVYVLGYSKYLQGIRPNSLQMSREDLMPFPIILPSLPEQQAIARFLDRECGKIDALIAEQERLIALLAEKRQAVISHAVTKGLNTNAPMKDSGIPWIGMVPEGWEVVRLSLVSDHISSGTTPDTNNENFYDGDICWVTTGELREAAIKNTTKKVTKLALEKFSALQIYPPGTLLLAMYGATVGRIAWLETHATTNQACCALVFSKKIKMKFVFYTMLAAKESLLLLSSGGGQPNINQEKVRSFRIPVPSLSEQSKIIDFLDSNMKDLDSLSGKIEKTLLLFKERRSALISAAVTGKIDVRAQSKAIAA